MKFSFALYLACVVLSSELGGSKFRILGLRIRIIFFIHFSYFNDCFENHSSWFQMNYELIFKVLTVESTLLTFLLSSTFIMMIQSVSKSWFVSNWKLNSCTDSCLIFFFSILLKLTPEVVVDMYSILIRYVWLKNSVMVMVLLIYETNALRKKNPNNW